MRKGYRITALCLIIALLMSLLTASAESFPEVLAQVKQGVVQIYGVGYDARGKPVACWSGSGFAVGVPGEDSDTFVTNCHCAAPWKTEEDNAEVTSARIWILRQDCGFSSVTLRPSSAASVECTVVKITDGYPDYAILRTLGGEKPAKALRLGSAESVLDGTTVYALGYPGDIYSRQATHSGTDDMTVTNGIISQHMVLVDAGGTSVVLSTAQVASGNSGGPLITADGTVVGINTYGSQEEEDAATSRYYAVYIDYVTAALDELGIAYASPINADTAVPETTPATVPETTIPETTVSPTTVPETTAPETSAPTTTVPETTIPEATESPSTAPETTTLETAAPSSAGTGHPWVPAGIAVGVLILAAAVFLLVRRLRRGGSGFVVRSLTGLTWQIPGAGLTVGRDEACGLRLPADTPGVSRHHCRLAVIRGKLYISDLGSTYGTYVGGRRLPPHTPVELRRGEVIGLGADEPSLIVG